ncbi:MAG: hypothetical protein GQ531_10880 [Sulfurovum sp.]|nr:hypothetical protein [Sulfurovum sp.]
MKQFKFSVLLSILVVLFGACENKNNSNDNEEKIYKTPYVDFTHFTEGRECNYVAFRCLHESQDKSWQEQNLSDGLDTFELTPEVMKKRKDIVQRWRDEEDGKAQEEDMKTAAISEAFYDRVEAKKFLVDMAERLEKEFPGFWRDVAKPVRYRWIRRAMSKAKNFGYKSTKPGPMMELCARIGLDFDKDAKWQYIVKFITSDPKNIGTNMGKACHYIDWTILNKTHGYTGTKITDWSMRRTNGWLPYPKKPYPKLGGK